MAGLVTILIILGCVAYQYQKGNIVKSFAGLIIIICSSIVAFCYFEVLADVFLSRSANSKFSSVVPWAQSLSFILLLVIAFSIFQTIAGYLTRQPVSLGNIADKAGSCIFGLFTGLVLAGLLLTILVMAPLSNKWPYQRFDTERPNPERPDKASLNADGFVTGLFSMISKGSFSGKMSFATLHPAFLDQVFLNRLAIGKDMLTTTSSQVIEMPKKNAVRAAGEDIKTTDDPNSPVDIKTASSLTIVRVGIKKKGLGKKATFTLSQLRLICKPKDDSGNRFKGTGVNIFPIGYLKAADRLQTKKINDIIKISPREFKKGIKWFNFAFYVPNDFVPVLIEFKQNSIAEVSLNTGTTDELVNEEE